MITSSVDDNCGVPTNLSDLQLDKVKAIKPSNTNFKMFFMTQGVEKWYVDELYYTGSVLYGPFLVDRATLYGWERFLTDFTSLLTVVNVSTKSTLWHVVCHESRDARQSELFFSYFNDLCLFCLLIIVLYSRYTYHI